MSFLNEKQNKIPKSPNKPAKPADPDPADLNAADQYLKLSLTLAALSSRPCQPLLQEMPQQEGGFWPAEPM